MQRHKRQNKKTDSIMDRYWDKDSSVKTQESSSRFCQRCAKDTPITEGGTSRIRLHSYFDYVQLFFCKPCLKEVEKNDTTES